jgi:hypothetical protein
MSHILDKKSKKRWQEEPPNPTSAFVAKDRRHDGIPPLWGCLLLFSQLAVARFMPDIWGSGICIWFLGFLALYCIQ